MIIKLNEQICQENDILKYPFLPITISNSRIIILLYFSQQIASHGWRAARMAHEVPSAAHGECLVQQRKSFQDQEFRKILKV